MARAAPVRSSHTSTAGMLAWPHPEGAGPLPPRRPNQPTEEFRKVVFGGQATRDGDGDGDEGLTNKMRTRTAPKWKEMTGSGIFGAQSAAAAPTASRDRQASQISFAEDGTIPPRKPTSVAEVSRQRELSSTVQSEGDGTMKRQVSNAKSKELSGHDIFADHEDPRHNNRSRSSPARNANVSTFSFGDVGHDSAPKIAKKATSNKAADLMGKDVLARDGSAKLEEKMISASVLADGKAPATREQAGRRTRQPPGGDSSISLG